MFSLRSLFVLILFIVSVSLYGQEICDNAIDDDGDGLIDLNDDDCVCIGLIPSSLIPNPSFEEMTCCPTQNAQLDCAVDWIQASGPTTDYVHTCDNYLGNSNIPAFAPLPFPDGEGAVGFRDGEAFSGSSYKEYVGACLNESMEAGVSYTLDFFVGFRDNVAGSMDFKMAIFASTSCANLPFSNNTNTGCPANAGGYVQLAELDVSGSNEWVNVVFEFEADQAYNVVVMGPACAPNPNWNQSPYFYVDRLALAESASFGVPYENIAGKICENNLVLSVEEDPLNSYQWYLDGIAILGETSSSLALASTTALEGVYQVVINTPQSCFFSSEYVLRIPPYYATDQVTLCEDGRYALGDTIITDAGYHEITIIAEDGCDSIIQLTIDMLPHSRITLEDTFCEEDTYTFLNIETDQPGTYMDTLVNAQGCDSIITIELSVIPIGTGISLVDSITVELGELANIIPSNVDPNVIEFSWTDEQGLEISTTDRLLAYATAIETTVSLKAVDINGCIIERNVNILIDDSNIRLYVPNIFSPDNDGVNDYFKFYENKSLKSIKRFDIYDRWGEKIMSQTNITNKEFLGWDGEFNGTDAMTGVYTYVIEAEFLDETVKTYSGDITLLR